MSESRSGDASRHVSVMPGEVLQHLAIRPGETHVDVTTGAGGHARLIADAVGPTGRLIALDQDSSMLDLARRRLEGTLTTFVQASFADLGRVLEDLGIAAVDGVLADLGICSDQLDDANRGFSFIRPGPLDMRMNTEVGEPASDLLHRLPERDLADLIYEFGEERFSRRIAHRIVEVRRTEAIRTTEQLAALVRRCVPRSPGKSGKLGIDPATRVFQALRIAVNGELDALDRLLEDLPGCLRPGGRVVFISFHSLEDRRVKQALRNHDLWEQLTRKPVVASTQETTANPRSRSAKLRAARRLTPLDPDRNVAN